MKRLPNLYRFLVLIVMLFAGVRPLSGQCKWSMLTRTEFEAP